MSYGECQTCHALLLTEDHACRICNRPRNAGDRVPEPVAAAAREAHVRRPPTRAIRGSWRSRPHVAAPTRRERPAAVAGELETIDLRGPVPTVSSAGSGPGSVAAISVRGLTKTYGDGDLAVHAVQDVTFEVHDGEVVLIMGPSGSGKTTLLLMLGAMLRPTSGSVVIGGTSLSVTPEKLLPKVRATHLGFIFQDFNLLSALSATENVELACNLAGTTGRRARARARDLLDRVDLGHRLDFKPNLLSGGEKQRVAVARALANDPPLLLADEPTANLDARHGREIGRLLRHLADEEGRTSLIVTHDDRLTEIADRVLWLQDGRLHAKEAR